ncbi:MAG TPA: peptidylprolyl isomerase [Pyrinomonadaceae bacterium]|jgi:cyclophilin family peptidyl-prolyl cis-trans isomerase/HEAT repeat protein
MPKHQDIETIPGWPRLVQSAATGGLAALIAALLLICAPGLALAQKKQQKPARASAENPKSAVPEELMLAIVRAEDERRWDDSLARLLFDRNPGVRRRAALAAGRIGDERAVSALATLLQSDREEEVREMAAFALGEVESATAADALLAALSRASETSQVRARIVEAIGKITAALPKAEEARGVALGQAVLSVLDREAGLGPRSDRRTVLLGLTAALRAHPDRVGPVLGKFLSHKDWRVRADALNALARLRNGAANDMVRPLLVSDAEPVVRANAARVLGATEDKASLDALVARATTDADERVRVSSVRALASLKEPRAATPLLGRGGLLLAAYRTSKAAGTAHPREAGELLEIATALGRLLANRGDVRAVAWLKEFRTLTGWSEPEIEVALAHIAPAAYLRDEPFNKLSDETMRARVRRDWRVVSAVGQALGEIGRIAVEEAGSGVVGLQADAQIMLRSLLDDAALPSVGVPDLLRALAAFKPPDAGPSVRKYLGAKDPLVRAAAADLLGELGPDEENARALASALPVAMRDELNDAALSTLDALARQRSAPANDAIRTALDSTDMLVRRRAVALLKANEAGDFSARLGQVATRNTVEDYRRALSRRNGRVRATVTTDKGSFIIELLPEDAPLTVDNFVQLARRGYFDGVTFHRVVPNFVIQGGDPRGDGNGGPGYQIRCEINEVEYERGAVGMALSGKDTGGSQWFVTHSPQPHLDGGYTVFGRVETAASLNVVDAIERGDKIQSITIAEGAASGLQRQASGAGK